ncbi:hypothetical protein Sango_2861800 [Sesamum angolense]|uniref:DDE Tnp4 domain-containing protein n=1 Tax=Sesamum angolense TaxID=2727404 RepID=A0AAE1T6N8_9LAMI|nr:hypothetical protein Sango_2861800 [Sesamum angolense]
MIFGTGPDRSVRPVQSGTGHVSGPVQTSKFGMVKTDKNRSNPAKTVSYRTKIAHQNRNSVQVNGTCIAKCGSILPWSQSLDVFDLVVTRLTLGSQIKLGTYVVLDAIILLHKTFLARLTAIGDDCTDNRWRFFKTRVVSEHWMELSLMYESVNKIRVGSAADSRVFHDALNRRNGLRVPTGNYYLCDNGYSNAETILTLY